METTFASVADARERAQASEKRFKRVRSSNIDEQSDANFACKIP
jgi:hypothetical protein